jgi:biopolymer transport protein ExbB
MTIRIPTKPLAAAALLLALAAPALAETGTAAQELVDNPYGLAALWDGGDAVARGTLLILLIMSMASWYVMVTKLAEQALLSRAAREAERGFWTAPSLGAGIAALSRRSAFRAIAEEGLAAVDGRDGALLGEIDCEARVTLALQRGGERVASRMQRSLALLATVGSTAPFIGLFGTVWGIYHALTAIGISGQASIDKVAGPVGEALIMTAMGLAVAVPAVLGYNWMVRRNKVALDRVRAFSTHLHALLQAMAAAPAKPVKLRA